MKFEEAVDIVSEEPLFETGLLLAGDVDPADLRRQLSRWAAADAFTSCGADCTCWRRRGGNSTPHPFLVANRLAPGSYVSGLSALAHAGAIPEYVPETTSVTAGQAAASLDPLGRFSFRHMKDA